MNAQYLHEKSEWNGQSCKFCKTALPKPKKGRNHFPPKHFDGFKSRTRSVTAPKSLTVSHRTGFIDPTHKERKMKGNLTSTMSHSQLKTSVSGHEIEAGLLSRVYG
jgi:hypothetical protein